MLSTNFLTKSKNINGSTGQWNPVWEPYLPRDLLYMALRTYRFHYS